MTRIPFIEATFFDPHETPRMIEERLMAYLRKLRVVDLSVPMPESEEDDEHAPSIPLAPPKPARHSSASAIFFLSDREKRAWRNSITGAWRSTSLSAPTIAG